MPPWCLDARQHNSILRIVPSDATSIAVLLLEEEVVQGKIFLVKNHILDKSQNSR